MLDYTFPTKGDDVSDEIIVCAIESTEAQALLRHHTITITQQPWVTYPKLEAFMRYTAKRFAELAIIDPPAGIDTSSPTWRKRLAEGASATQKKYELDRLLEAQSNKMCKRFYPIIGGELGQLSPILRKALVELSLFSLAIDMGQLAWCFYLDIPFADAILPREHYEHRIKEDWNGAFDKLPIQPIFHYVDPT